MKPLARRSPLLLLPLLGALGCGPEDGLETEESSGAIEGGQLETGYPMVGMITFTDSGGSELCTGSLISQSWVLTAAHCFGTNMVFRTGNTWATAVSHAVDRLVPHPQLDLMVVHLTTPIDNVPVLNINEGALPAVGTVCTAVGFGDHTDATGTFNTTKRSGTEQITFASSSEVDVKMVSGIIGGGDSGGPLLCGGQIAAVTKGIDAGVKWPNYSTAYYRPVDATWIANTIAPAYTELTLQNLWTNAPYSTRNAAVGFVAGSVQLKGAIATTGTNAVAFTLPTAYRPSAAVYVPVDLCGGARGNLYIQTNGVVTVQAESFSSAQCFTSLEGVSFAPSILGNTALPLQPGWVNSPKSTSSAGAQLIGGTVQLRGAVKTTGTNQAPFTIPAGFRPAAIAYVKVGLCNSAVGRLIIDPSGSVIVEAEGPWSNAQCMVSLDGASYAVDSTAFTALGLQNGWTGAPYATAAPGVTVSSGVVRFKGAVANGTSSTLFTLPADMRPTTSVFLPVSLCNSSKGRLIIQPSGVVDVVPLASFSDAACFTSLEGVSFVLSDFTPLTTRNGWSPVAFGMTRAAYSVSDGIVLLKGGLSTSATSPSQLALVLPPAIRPAADVYLPVSLVSGRKGRLQLTPTGEVYVYSQGSFTDATTLTSLDGVSYVLSSSGYTTLPPQNGWTGAPYSTRAPAGKALGNVVHLMGAVSTAGSNGTIFTLPAALRPASNVFLPVDLCGGNKGRLTVTSGGTATVSSVGAGLGSDATCFTSLEGVTFTKAATFTPVTFKNGWSNYGFYPVASSSAMGIVRLQGTMSGGTTTAFTLPPDSRPPRGAYVQVDLCNGAQGRADISSNGDVYIEAGDGNTANVSCFTSLEGVWFAL